MRPEASNSSGKSQSGDTDSKNARKTLHILQPAAGDKENLVGPGRSVLPSEKDPKKMRDDVELKNLINEVINEDNAPKTSKKKKKMISRMVQTEKPRISEEDLTSEAGPSENYWEVIAERRRMALEEALKENATLLEKIDILAQEKAVTEELLKEARSMVEVLTEIIEDNDNETEP